MENNKENIDEFVHVFLNKIGYMIFLIYWPHSYTILSGGSSKSEKVNAAFLAHNKIDVSNAALPDNHPNSNVDISNLDITVQDVREVLKTLDTNKSLGPWSKSNFAKDVCKSNCSFTDQIIQLLYSIWKIPR